METAKLDYAWRRKRKEAAECKKLEREHKMKIELDTLKKSVFYNAETGEN